MESEIKNLRFSKENPNLKKSEFRALRKLKNNIDIVTKPADKGSATVIMNKNYYNLRLIGNSQTQNITKNLEHQSILEQHAK